MIRVFLAILITLSTQVFSIIDTNIQFKDLILKNCKNTENKIKKFFSRI